MPCFLSPVVFGQVLRFLREFLLSGAKSDPKTNRRLYIPFQTTKTHVRWIIFDVLSRWTSCLVSLAVYGQVLRFLKALLPIRAVKQHQNTCWDIDPSFDLFDAHSKTELHTMFIHRFWAVIMNSTCISQNTHWALLAFLKWKLPQRLFFFNMELHDMKFHNQYW